MRQYLTLLQDVMDKGIRKKNRTGVDHFGYTGDMMKFDMADGFPAVTTKRLAFKSVVAEMLCFLRGCDNVKEFQELGCRVWDANAEADYWLRSPYCKGDGDLGRIYGVQARDWGKKSLVACTGYDEEKDSNHEVYSDTGIDQLLDVYMKLKKGEDDRRLIVTHWNPSELIEMALPPCHMFYQFGIQGDKLNLSMYQRSCDVPLGIPFNIAGYAWLLSVMAHITGLQAGEFTHFMHDVHIYENQLEFAKIQAHREPMKLPELYINPDIKTLHDLETWVTPDDFSLIGYDHHPHIVYPFSV